MLTPMLSPDAAVVIDSALPKPNNRVALKQLIARVNVAENTLAQVQADLAAIEALVTVQRDAQGKVTGVHVQVSK